MISSNLYFHFQLLLPAGGRLVRAARQEIWGCQWKRSCQRESAGQRDSERVFANICSIIICKYLQVSETAKEYMDVTLDDLEVIATLGVGGFGRVELVKVIG